MHLNANHRFSVSTALAAAVLLFFTSSTSTPRCLAAGPYTSTTPVIRSMPNGTVVGTACPKCGRFHGNQPIVITSPSTVSNATTGAESVVATSYRPATESVTRTTGIQNVLAMLNQQRSRQGLRSLRYDPALQAVAERRVRLMASTGTKSHPPGSFSPGRYEGVGWSSSYSPSGVHACYTSNPNMTAAGAAMARGRDGVYFTVVYR